MSNTNQPPKWFMDAQEKYGEVYSLFGDTSQRNGDEAHDLGCQSMYGDAAILTSDYFNELADKYEVDADLVSTKISDIIVAMLETQENLKTFIKIQMDLLNNEDAQQFSKDFVDYRGYNKPELFAFAKNTLGPEGNGNALVKSAYAVYGKFLMTYSPVATQDTAAFMYNGMPVPGSKYFNWDVVGAVNVMTTNMLFRSIK